MRFLSLLAAFLVSGYFLFTWSVSADKAADATSEVERCDVFLADQKSIVSSLETLMGISGLTGDVDLVVAEVRKVAGVLGAGDKLQRDKLDEILGKVNRLRVLKTRAEEASCKI